MVSDTWKYVVMGVDLGAVVSLGLISFVVIPFIIDYREKKVIQEELKKKQEQKARDAQPQQTGKDVPSVFEDIQVKKKKDKLIYKGRPDFEFVYVFEMFRYWYIWSRSKFLYEEELGGKKDAISKNVSKENIINIAGDAVLFLFRLGCVIFGLTSLIVEFVLEYALKDLSIQDFFTLFHSWAFLAFFLYYLFQNMVASILSTAVFWIYWVPIATSDPYEFSKIRYFYVGYNGVNVILNLIEFFLNNITIKIWHLTYSVLFASLYLVYLTLSFESGSFTEWPYGDTFDYSTNEFAVLSHVVFALSPIAIFLVLFAISFGRKKLFEFLTLGNILNTPTGKKVHYYAITGGNSKEGDEQKILGEDTLIPPTQETVDIELKSVDGSL